MTYDLLRGNETKTVLRFSLPLMGAMALQAVYSLTDSIIIGNFVSPEAFGAIGLLSPCIMLLNAFCTALGQGVSILTAQYFGAGRDKELRRAAGTGLCLAVILSVLLIAFSVTVSGPLVRGLLRTPAEMEADSLLYLRVYAGALIFQMLYQTAYGILCAHGDSRSSLLFLLVSVVMNIGLDLLFVCLLKWEVAGAAYATAIAQATAAAAALLYLKKKYPALLASGSLRPDRDSGRRVLSLACPILCRSAVLSIGFIILQRLCNSFGAASIEGYAAMQKVETFIHIVPNALCTALSAFTGQNLGAGRPERVRRAYKGTVFFTMGVSAGLAVLMILFDTRLLSLFNLGPEALRRGCEHLDLLVLFMFLYGSANVTTGLLQGAGDVRVPTVSTFVNLFIRVGLAYLLAGTKAGYRCIFWSLPPAWTSAFLINFLRYRSGKWASAFRV